VAHKLRNHSNDSTFTKGDIDAMHPLVKVFIARNAIQIVDAYLDTVRRPGL
jgi:hypothetical protein